MDIIKHFGSHMTTYHVAARHLSARQVFEMVELLGIVTTKPGSESRALSELQNLFQRYNVNAEAQASRTPGVIEMRGSTPKGLLAAAISRNKLAFVNKAILFHAVSQADLRSISETASRAVRSFAMNHKADSFKVRTEQRSAGLGEGGKLKAHEVDVFVGDFIRRELGLRVELETPSLTVLVELLGDEAGIALIPG